MPADTGLEPIDPHRAVELYLDARRNDISENTFRTQRSRLRRFAEWCHSEGVENLNNLSGRNLHAYRMYVRDRFEDEQGEANALTIRTRLSTVRVFLRYASTIEAVPETLPEKIVLPTVDREDRRREEIIDTDYANHVLNRLRDRHYATTEHIVFALAWKIGLRLGAIHSIDVDDVDTENCRLELVHRPNKGTTLKNKQSGERVVALDEQLVSAIERHCEVTRLPTTDDYDREPLLTTRHGRPDKSTLREWLYKAQLPCFHSNDCPHGEMIADCEYRRCYNRADCPSTSRPHDIRRGAITRFLADDIPHRAVSDRTDVSGDVLDEHYDQRSEVGKAEQRREYFE